VILDYVVNFLIVMLMRVTYGLFLYWFMSFRTELKTDMFQKYH